MSAHTSQSRQALILATRQHCELRKSWGAPFSAWLARVAALLSQALSTSDDPLDMAVVLAACRTEIRAAWEWDLGAADATCWVARQALTLSQQQRARITDLAWQATQHDWALHHAIRAAREAARDFAQAYAGREKQ